MNDALQDLTIRIRSELSDLDEVVQRALHAWPRAVDSSDDQPVYIDSVALNLHGLYSGLERLFELTARYVDKSSPSGVTWHRELLHQMGQDIEHARPAVLSQTSIDGLDQLRRFRHVVRHAYTLHLIPENIAPLISTLSGLWTQIQAELLAFADFLDALNKEA